MASVCKHKAFEVMVFLDQALISLLKLNTFQYLLLQCEVFLSISKIRCSKNGFTCHI